MKSLCRTTAACALAALAGCSIVKSSRIRGDWEQVDRQRVKRLAIVTQPHPAQEPKLGELWSTLAARQVDLKRSFIIKDIQSAGDDATFDPLAHCGEGIEGVLWLRPDVKRQGEGVEAAVTGRLLRCVDGEEVWSAEAAGSWGTHDEGLEQTIADYTAEFGPEVTPYVAATYRLLLATLETLPDPVLTEEDTAEKIEHGL